jgi:peptidoglycan hydrolase-like protein with peptidoglycan-binding domain
MTQLLLLILLALIASRRTAPSTPEWPGTPSPSPAPPKPTTPSTPSPSPAPASTPSDWVTASAPAELPWPSAWEPDVPAGPAVVARANALLPLLWGRGEGSRTTEQTAGRWTTYVATRMGDKRGVVVFRPRIATAPAATPVSTTAKVSTLRTLRKGSVGTDVAILQRRLGIAADGNFGPLTDQAVRNWQAAHSLTTDGIVGPQTWASLSASGGMTA